MRTSTLWATRTAPTSPHSATTRWRSWKRPWLEREFGIQLGDEVVADARTPAELTALVNRTVAEAA
ncbi:hypothetical protein ACFQ3Z_36235 [Streptomyces nogalater]